MYFIQSKQVHFKMKNRPSKLKKLLPIENYDSKKCYESDNHFDCEFSKLNFFRVNLAR